MTIVTMSNVAQIQEKKINIGGYDMNLTPCRRFINSCKAKIEDDIPYILFAIEQLLARPDVTERLLNEVRIGSSVVIVDEVNHYT